MNQLQRVSGEIHWDKPLGDALFAKLQETTRSSLFLTPRWFDVTRATLQDKGTIFRLLHALAPVIRESSGTIDLMYADLTFEFFTVREGQLHRQDATVRWETKQLVHADTRLNYAGMYEYSGMLKLPPLERAKHKAITTLIDQYGTPYFERETNRIIIHHTSDDFNRWYTKMLAELAEIIGTATGYITCELLPKDARDVSVNWERYQIVEGHMLVQQGALEFSELLPIQGA